MSPATKLLTGSVKVTTTWIGATFVGFVALELIETPGIVESST
jgi:hypothetical protein